MHTKIYFMCISSIQLSQHPYYALQWLTGFDMTQVWLLKWEPFCCLPPTHTHTLSQSHPPPGTRATQWAASLWQEQALLYAEEQLLFIACTQVAVVCYSVPISDTSAPLVFFLHLWLNHKWLTLQCWRACTGRRDTVTQSTECDPPSSSGISQSPAFYRDRR